MHRSSESIGTIAAALAKAQAELINPEKSLVGIIGPSSLRGPGRAFRYAPLSSGLDIIRKSLGRHAIAIVQSTAIDKDAGLVRLNTVLAHASGEWVSSEWPVCPIGVTASPQRMGAALTYARRYALFTLVGIAGEDDLDAPDLAAAQETEAGNPIEPSGQFEPREHVAADHPNGLRNRKPLRRSPKTLLEPDASAALRDQLMIELTAVTTADEALAWAHRSLPAKNTLTAGDAQTVEERFQAKLSTISDSLTPDASPNAVPDQSELPAVRSDAGASQKTSTVAKKQSRSGAVRALGKTVRLRDKAHRKFVLRQPCLVCGRVPSDPHHLTFTQPRALGHRVSDEFTVPVCRIHHRELHRSGNEAAWWQKLNIDPLPVALRLWQHTRADGKLAPTSEGITQAQAAKTPDISAQDRDCASHDPRADPESAVSQNADGARERMTSF